MVPSCSISGNGRSENFDIKRVCVHAVQVGQIRSDIPDIPYEEFAHPWPISHYLETSVTGSEAIIDMIWVRCAPFVIVLTVLTNEVQSSGALGGASAVIGQ